jgi:uncharacterized peroxidase-related enzyme
VLSEVLQAGNLAPTAKNLQPFHFIVVRQQAMLDFAMQVALESATIEADDIDRLAEHGFSEEDVWDIGAIAAFFAMSNRMANLSGMRPNDEFYVMGR